MTTHRIELIYEQTCPNIDAARTLIHAACTQLGTAPVWQEWEIGDPLLPAHARGFGSPTILVDGHDVVGESAGCADCCRIYAGPQGVHGVPELAQVLAALRCAGAG